MKIRNKNIEIIILLVVVITISFFLTLKFVSSADNSQMIGSGVDYPVWNLEIKQTDNYVYAEIDQIDDYTFNVTVRAVDINNVPEDYKWKSVVEVVNNITVEDDQDLKKEKIYTQKIKNKAKGELPFSFILELPNYTESFELHTGNGTEVILGSGIGTGGGYESTNRLLTKTSAGTLVATFKDDASDWRTTRSLTNGTTWINETEHIAGTTQDMDCVINSTSDIHCFAQVTSYSIQHIYSIDEGETWISDYNYLKGNVSNRIKRFSVDIDSNDIFHFCLNTNTYQSDGTKQWLFYINSSVAVINGSAYDIYDNANNYVILNNDSADDTDICDIGVFDTGDVIVVGSGGDSDNIEAYMTGHSSWSNENNRIIVSTDGLSNQPIPVVITEGNMAYIVWETLGSNIGLAVRNNTAAYTFNVTNGFVDYTNALENPSLTIDKDNVSLFIAFEDKTNHTIYMVNTSNYTGATSPSILHAINSTADARLTFLYQNHPQNMRNTHELEYTFFYGTNTDGATVGTYYNKIKYDTNIYSWKEPDFAYRQNGTVTDTQAILHNSGEAFLIRLNTSALITAGKMQADCDDIRVWVEGESVSMNISEGSCNAVDTPIWVNLTYQLPISGSFVYHVYYGNTSATAPTAWTPDSSKWKINFTTDIAQNGTAISPTYTENPNGDNGAPLGCGFNRDLGLVCNAWFNTSYVPEINLTYGREIVIMNVSSWGDTSGGKVLISLEAFCWDKYRSVFVPLTTNTTLNNGVLKDLTNSNSVCVSDTIMIKGYGQGGISAEANFWDTRMHEPKLLTGVMSNIEEEQTTVDLTNPSVTLLFDTPDPVYNNTGIYINATVTDETSLDTVLLQVVRSGVYTNYSLSNTGDVYSINQSFAIPDNYTYQIFSNDSSNNFNTTESGTFEVIRQPDTFAPSITALTELPDPVEYDSTIYLNATVIDEIALSSVKVQVTYDNGSITNFSTSNVGNNYFTTVPTNELGTHTVDWFANDSSNNINATESGTFVVQDTTSPTLSSQTETPDPVEYNESIELNATCADNVECSFVNVQMTLAESGFKLNLSVTLNNGKHYVITQNTTEIGTYSLLWFANDTSGNIDTLASSFVVEDTIAPNITAITETTDPVNLGNTFGMNFTVFESASDVNNSLIQLNFSNGTFTNFSTYLSNGKYFNGSLPTNEHGVVSWRIIVNDTYNNLNNTETGSYTVNDVESPNITSISVNDSSIVQDEKIQVSMNVTDDGSIDSTFFMVTFPNSTITNYTGTSSSALYINISIPTSSTGQYNLTMWANDTADNINNTETLKFNVSAAATPSGSSGSTGASGEGDGNLLSKRIDDIPEAITQVEIPKNVKDIFTPQALLVMLGLITFPLNFSKKQQKFGWGIILSLIVLGVGIFSRNLSQSIIEILTFTNIVAFALMFVAMMTFKKTKLISTIMILISMTILSISSGILPQKISDSIIRFLTLVNIIVLLSVFIAALSFKKSKLVSLFFLIVAIIMVVLAGVVF